MEINSVSKFKLWQSNKLTKWQTKLNAFSNLFTYSSIAFFLVVAALFLLSLLPNLFIASYLLFPSNHISHSISLSLYLSLPMSLTIKEKSFEQEFLSTYFLSVKFFNYYGWVSSLICGGVIF